ncbi:MAG TPA: SDR family NAD(P)-dependent oxidoreductase [Candidatus Limnocylindria bacterium]|nr:SDR family NAD(P)-dependent oxidoreductase [Candidatus Limnocylindria bacterium]
MDVRALVDDLLEISVVGSFTDVGYEVRSRLFDWRPPPADVLRGRTVVITGPTSGLGRAAAGELAELGARLVLVGRDPDKLGAVRDELLVRHGEDRFATVEADLSSLASVGRAADEILAGESRLDVLVDNAGAMFHERRESPDGIELTLATMVVGPFSLISRLLPLLRAEGGARVISVTSGGMYAQGLPLDDLQFSGAGYSGPKAYARAKRAQTALMREWARRLEGSGVTFNAMHPGWADTPGLADMLPGFERLIGPRLRIPQEGADTIVWLAADPAAATENGGLYLDRRRRPFDRLPATRLTARDRLALWAAVARLAGL